MGAFLGLNMFCWGISAIWSSSSSSGKMLVLCWEGKRGMLKEPAGAAVWGTLAEEERTPPVRRPARSEARLFEFAVVIALSSQERIDNGITSGDYWKKVEDKAGEKEGLRGKARGEGMAITDWMDGWPSIKRKEEKKCIF